MQTTMLRTSRRVLLTGLLGLFAIGSAWSQSAAPQVQFDTTAGSFTVELYPKKAPQTVANFLQYVRDGHYQGTIFHRVIPGFMVQGGGFDAQMREKDTRPPIAIESNNGLSNERGTLAMARRQDPHSASAQFFVNVKDNDFLNYQAPPKWGYTVFGKVVRGMDVIDKIESVRTTTKGMFEDVPQTPIVINSATVLK